MIYTLLSEKFRQGFIQIPWEAKTLIFGKILRIRREFS